MRARKHIPLLPLQERQQRQQQRQQPLQQQQQQQQAGSNGVPPPQQQQHQQQQQAGAGDAPQRGQQQQQRDGREAASAAGSCRVSFPPVLLNKPAITLPVTAGPVLGMRGESAYSMEVHLQMEVRLAGVVPFA
jgi:hypothetical protein